MYVQFINKTSYFHELILDLNQLQVNVKANTYDEKVHATKAFPIILLLHY